MSDTEAELRAEIERLQAAKRRALAIADERAKEAVALRAALSATCGRMLNIKIGLQVGDTKQKAINALADAIKAAALSEEGQP